VRLRDVTLDDEALWVRLRCDPDMWMELGGPQAPETIPDKIKADVAAVEADESWISVVESDGGEPMGSVCIWTQEHGGAAVSEIGWMVLPEFQGRGVGKASVRAILERARDDGRWGSIHAYPGVTNDASNGICRSLGFTLVETEDFDYFGQTLRCHHWQIDPADADRRDGGAA
jgi:RimJ/RimL family protein N-acetyltransferase